MLHLRSEREAGEDRAVILENCRQVWAVRLVERLTLQSLGYAWQ